MGHDPELVDARNVGGYPKYSFVHCSYGPDVFNPPLKVLFAGNALWIKGCFRKRLKTSHYALVLVTTGDLIFNQDGNQYHVVPGEIHIIRKGCDMWFEPGPSGWMYSRVIRIDGPMLKPVLNATGLAGCDHICPRNLGRMVAFYKKAHKLLKERPDGYIAGLSGVAYTMLMELGHSLKQSQFPPAVSRAVNIIHSRIGSSLTREDLCDATNTSASTLTRLFKRHLGVGPMHYYRKFRMDTAAQMLLTSDLSIKQIAAQLGYSSQLYFSAEFKKQMGGSPKFYRAGPEPTG
jgi:AraC-like DNA-binding protein